MDWIREGKLSRLGKETEDTLLEVSDTDSETQLKTLSSLMTDLVNLSSILHSLQCKLMVARHKNNPKVFMWCNMWEDSACAATEEEHIQQPEMVPEGFINSPDCTDQSSMSVTETCNENDDTFETVPDESTEESKMAKSNDTNWEEKLEEKSDSKTEPLGNGIESSGEKSSDQKPDNDEVKASPVKDSELIKATEETSEDTIPVKSSPDNESIKEVNGHASESRVNGSVEKDDDEKVQDMKDENIIKEKENVAQPLATAPTDNQNSFGSQLTEYFSTEEGFDLQTLLPSVSEMQRMLPDVIKDISGSLTSGSTTFSGPPVLPPPNIIPEPKRLDREECRQNLLVHIESLQKHVEDRLEAVELAIEDIEKKRRDSSAIWNGMSISSRMQDVKSAKIVNYSLPDKL